VGGTGKQLTVASAAVVAAAASVTITHAEAVEAVRMCNKGLDGAVERRSEQSK